MSLSAMRTPWLRPACWASLLCVRMIPRHLFVTNQIHCKTQKFKKYSGFAEEKILAPFFSHKLNQLFCCKTILCVFSVDCWLLTILVVKVFWDLLASPVVAISTLLGSNNSLKVSVDKTPRRCLSRKLGFKKSDSVSLFPRRLSLSLLGGSSLNEWRRAIESQLQPNRLSLGVAIPQRTRVPTNSKILKFQSESPYILHPISHYAPRIS